MDSDPTHFYLIFFFLLLFFSAFFSGSEAAFFSINKLLSQKLDEENSSAARRMLALLKHPRRLLITILIGNTLVNVTAASVATLLVLQIARKLEMNQSVAMLINVGVVTFLILIFGEITPKVIAVKNPERFAKSISIVLRFISYLFLPISFLLDKLMEAMTSSFGFREHEKERLLHVDEFQTLLDIGEEEGSLEEDEKEMLHSIFEFGATTVREIMIPRTDVVCVADDISLPELIEVIKTKGHTRIPVYLETIDQIQGIINAKDLLSLDPQRIEKVELLKLARPPIYVPESKKIDDLLRLFQKERQHLAVVVDEYGGTSGIVTLEDIIEEIVGEIRDEYDKETSLHRKIDEKTFLVNAKIDIESLNELMNIKLPESDEYETLGGFVLQQIGSLPKEGESIRFEDYVLKMEKMEKNRIVLIRISHEPLPPRAERDFRKLT
ncbi:HlyC/CorC family transporter [candidate division KSB1 bacterium]|nr:HlyC/CorC family transporter [candidate division KSB1 bacterium]RQW08788.1 MAG: HlyC/CorC family transporter [candidate division KSB1 bacterium]